MAKISKNYKPSQKEKFMNAKMKEYFRQKLENWKGELLKESSQTINNLQTEPIVISVVNEGPRSNQDNDELFLEIEVNKEALYVQEQLLFTVKLYYTINGIRNPQFTELEMEDTVIQLIGSPNQYEQIIEGVRYGVYEKRYVIFPQRSGPLEIPDILFRLSLIHI